MWPVEPLRHECLLAIRDGIECLTSSLEFLIRWIRIFQDQSSELVICRVSDPLSKNSDLFNFDSLYVHAFFNSVIVFSIRANEFHFDWHQKLGW